LRFEFVMGFKLVLVELEIATLFTNR